MTMNASGDMGVASGATTPLFELGRGGMGVASLSMVAGPGGFERLVVVKRLHPHLCERADVVARFLDEARLAACIRHANVISTHHVGRDAQGYFLTLEYIEGASLEELCDRAALRGEAIPPSIVMRIGLDALAGLDAAYHARDASGRQLSLLHRDVSLQNLLVGCDGVARLADFGIAKSELSSVKTTDGFLLGKLVYLPPEYLQRSAFGPELDVYSLGVTLWIALTGRDPWPDADEPQLIKAIFEDGVPPLSSVIEIAPEIEQIVATACARDRGSRFDSARAMADRIEGLGRGLLATHSEVAELVERLAGKDLERRRELVARRVSEVASGAVPAGEDVVTEEIPRPERRWPRVAVLAGVVVLVGVAGWFSVSRFVSQRQPGVVEATAPEPERVDTTPAASVRVVSEPPPSPPVADAAPAESAPGASAKPVRPKRPATERDPISNKPGPGPETISKKNPYH